MYLSLAGPAVELVDSKNFGEFYVDAAGRPLPQIAGASNRQSAGTIRGGHAWIDSAYIESELTLAGGNWQEPFETMLAYAQSRDWVSRQVGRGAVRAHIENIETG